MSFYENLWYFFIYAVLGWIVEVSFSAFCGRGFVNRGFFYGPMCCIYGYTILAMVLLMTNYKSNPLILYMGCALIASFSELFIGWFSHSILGTHLWDYSDRPLNLGGHICLSFCLIWGVLGSLVVLYVHPFLQRLVSAIPRNAGHIALTIILSVFLFDVMFTCLKYIGSGSTISVHTSQ